jgi:CsoR family transcriptional regulator, copper-sensing transcriptional repressor
MFFREVPMATRRVRNQKQSNDCCSEESAVVHPDHTAVLPRLNRVQGQISGIEKMIGDGRYCVDILIQFRAAMAALRTIEVEIFEKHLNHCVNSALLAQDKKQAAEKVRELTELLSRRTSL